MISDKYYKTSGKIGFAGLVIVPICAVLIGAAIGAVYGIVSYEILYIVIKTGSILISGAAIGLLLGLAARLCKVRSMGFVMLFSLLAGLVSLYTGWIGYILAMSDYNKLVLHPDAIINVMGYMVEHGTTWKLGGTPSGIFLCVLWVIESLFIVVMSVLMAQIPIHSLFCEHCNKWIKSKKMFGPFVPVKDRKKTKQLLEQGYFTELEELQYQPGTAAESTIVELYFCPACTKSNFINVIHRSIKKDVKGNEVSNDLTFVERLILSEEMRSRLERIMGEHVITDKK